MPLCLHPVCFRVFSLGLFLCFGLTCLCVYVCFCFGWVSWLGSRLVGVWFGILCLLLPVTLLVGWFVFGMRSLRFFCLDWFDYCVALGWLAVVMSWWFVLCALLLLIWLIY